MRQFQKKTEVMDHKQFNIWIAGCWSTEFWTPPSIILKVFSPVWIFSRSAGRGIALKILLCALGLSQEELNGVCAFHACVCTNNAIQCFGSCSFQTAIFASGSDEGLETHSLNMREVAKETLQGISVMACVYNVESFNACVVLHFYSFQVLLHSFESTTAPFFSTHLCVN